MLPQQLLYNFLPGNIALYLLALLLVSSSIIYSQNNNQPKPLVVTTNSILKDMVHQLAGDELKVLSIVPTGLDPHNFDPGPTELVNISRADLILINGLNLESWIMNLIDQSSTMARVDTATRGIIPLLSGRYHSVIDPHAWLDPILGKKYIDNISISLIQLLPHAKETIEFNKDVLLKELQSVHNFTKERLSEIPEIQQILITSHDAFQYFGLRYGLKVESVFPSSAEAEITIRQMADLSNLIKSTGAKAIFPESTINARLVKQIAKDNSIQVGGKLYTDSLSDSEGDAPTYIDMLYHNANTIYAGLKGVETRPSIPLAKDETPVWLTVAILMILSGSFLFMFFKMDPKK